MEWITKRSNNYAAAKSDVVIVRRKSNNDRAPRYGVRFKNGKHQTLDKIEKKNEYQKEYMREYREKQKQIACKTNSNTNSKTNVSLLEEELELDKELDKDIKDNRAKSTRFVPPTHEEVENYCLERNNKVDAERFIDFYSSKGWMVGKNKMKDWKACIRTWERSNSTSTQQTQKPVKKSAMEMVLESLKGE